MTRRRAGIASLALAVAIGACVTFHPFGSTFSVLVSNVGYVLGALGGTVMCAVGARRRRGRARLAWHVMAAGLGCWAASNVLWLYYESIARVPVPSPGPYDIGYVSGITLVGIAVGLLLKPSLRSASAVRTLADGLLIASSLFYVAWTFLLSELPELDGSAERAVTWIYPVVDLALACVAVLALSRAARSARSCWLLLTGGTLVLTSCDTVWAYSNLSGAFESGSTVDALWVAGYLIIGLAALTPGGAGERGGHAVADRWTAFVPYVPFSLVLVTAALRPGVADDPVRLLLGIAATGLLFARQVLAVLENQRLARDLEARVAERTAELAQSEALFRAVGSTISDAVVVLDEDMTLRWASAGLRRVAGYGAEELRGRGVLHLVHRDDVHAVIALAEQVASEPGSSRLLRCRVRVVDGSYGHAEITMANLLDHPDIGGFLLAIRDVREQQALQERLRYRAEHDDLTGLANRSALVERLGAVLDDGRQPAVVLLDLDGFKSLNDSHGHAVGDELLRAVAVRLDAAVRPTDVVARLGGDEFAIVVDGTHDDAVAVAQRVAHELDGPIALAHRVVRCRASVGVATVGDRADDLLRNADLAMYAAKARGGNGVEVFHAGMHDQLVRRVRVEEALRSAVLRNELHLKYQPIVDLASGMTVGAEALLRWELDGEPVEPSEFIAIAEESGQIVDIGRWVLTEACAAAAVWYSQRPDGPLIRLAVNVSAHQLAAGDLVGDVERALRSSGLPAACLTLEVTESAVMERHAEAASTLGALRALGVRVAIDDFGTGYSSLGRLQDLPVDEIKIDRSFVGTISTGEDVVPVVDAVVALARSLRLEVVAEGIETDEQRLALLRAGCPSGQGYLFGAAESGDRLTTKLANGTLNFSV